MREYKDHPSVDVKAGATGASSVGREAPILASHCSPPTPLHLTTYRVQAHNPREHLQGANIDAIQQPNWRGSRRPRRPRSRNRKLQVIVGLTLLCSIKSTARRCTAPRCGACTERGGIAERYPACV
jgi:hypothetical protein